MDQFWRFIAERQHVWHRRHVERLSPPWTNDEIIRNYRFTNVYRILDPGTQYAVNRILDTPHDPEERLFNLTLYRILGRRETHQKIGFLHFDSLSPEAVEKRLRDVKQNGGHPVFTGAYIVAPYHQYGGKDKVENVSRLAACIRDFIPDIYDRIQAADGLDEVYKALRDVPGLGRFLAYQVAVDLTYPLPRAGESFLAHSQEEWAIAGPGAQRGLKILRPRGVASDLEVMRWLRDNQSRGFGRLGLEFPSLREPDGTEKPLSLADIQNCLCEFSKYCRIRENPASARRRFREDKAGESPLHVNQPKGWISR